MFSKALISVFLLLLGSCASWDYPRPGPTCQDLRFNELPNSATRLEFQDFSISPPQGPNWCVVGLDRKGAAVFMKNQWGGKIIQKRPEEWQIRQALMAIISIDHPKENIDDPESIEKLIRHGPEEKSDKLGIFLPRVNTDNVRVIRENSFGNAICFKSEGTLTGELSESTPNAPLGLIVRHLICKHPTKRMLITLGYGERYLQIPKPAYLLSDKYKSELEQFVHSLQFKP